MLFEIINIDLNLLEEFFLFLLIFFALFVENNNINMPIRMRKKGIYCLEGLWDRVHIPGKRK